MQNHSKDEEAGKRHNVLISPCAACKMRRRRCTEKCPLAPYFPQSRAESYAAVHKIFGANNVIKMLQVVPLDKRSDAIKCMVIEASARVSDPVYGCTGIVCQLQLRVSQLRSQLTKAQSDLQSVIRMSLM